MTRRVGLLNQTNMKKQSPALLNSALINCFTFFVLLGSIASCVSPKSIIYFQGDEARYSSSVITDTYIPTIQKNDMLSIIVGSLSAEANEVFNSANRYSSTTNSYGSGGAASVQPFGYLVDAEGNIELPLIGKVKVEGLRTQEAADTLRKKLLVYLKEPSVTIRNINFKISVLGEVNRPAIYNIPDEKISLPEVLSLAGDLTIFGKRENVMIIREENGKREYIRVDLTSRKIFDSPYYYLHKNDVVYIEPVKARMNSTDRKVQLIPLFVSITTAVSLLLLRIR
jgi:polysaccharide export outer membrane protein